MAKTKKEIIEDLNELGIFDVSDKNTVAELNKILKETKDSQTSKEIIKEVVEEPETLDAENVINEIVEEVKSANGFITMKVSKDRLRQIEKEGLLFGNTSIVDGFCTATYREA